MTYPKAYDPQDGYKYQILVKTPYERAYEHCDYAIDYADKQHLLKIIKKHMEVVTTLKPLYYLLNIGLKNRLIVFWCGSRFALESVQKVIK